MVTGGIGVGGFWFFGGGGGKGEGNRTGLCGAFSGCRKSGGGVSGCAEGDSAGIGLAVGKEGKGERRRERGRLRVRGELEKGEGRIFDKLFNFDEEGDRLFAVDEAMIIR